MTDRECTVLDEQIAYYRTRAGEHDQWFERTGRFDRGEAHKARWQDEIARVLAALKALGTRDRCLELACGTGLWTRHLAQMCGQVKAVDASPEVIALNRARLSAYNVGYVEADLFDWRPSENYDLIFFSFWLSHVPEERFDAFWDMARGALSPGGTAFLVDSLYNPESTASDHLAPSKTGIVSRTLNDGQNFHIVKIFYTPQDLAARLEQRGWRAKLQSSGSFFLYGEAAPD
jgi:ubiquinone/menaquinone biosynthesis C-methylase UbiE